MELRNEKDARFIIRHHVTEEKLLHLEKGVRKLGFQSGGKRIMSIFLGIRVWNLCPFERLAGREKADPSPVRGGQDGR